MKKDEILFVGTAEAEHVEMYLKAIWHLKERKEDPKISTIAKMLNVRQPSVVQMLKRLNEDNLVNYHKSGVSLTKNGEEVGARMMRNSRLLEVLMDSALKMDIDEEMVCGIEHHMNGQFTDGLCTLLNHPRKCPHGHRIPPGECCREKREQPSETEQEQQQITAQKQEAGIQQGSTGEDFTTSYSSKITHGNGGSKKSSNTTKTREKKQDEKIT